MDRTELARFGHHPDPATDFCIEADCIEARAYDLRADFATYDEVAPRVARALDFRVGGDQHAIAAKHLLRTIAQEIQRYAPK